MRSSGEKNKKRGIFDVQISKKRISFYGSNVINLRPKFRTRHPRILFLIIGIVAVISFIGMQRLFTRAEVKDFSPSTCLGNWQNPANAAGKYDALTDATGSIFTSDNSAVFAGGNSQIFCGGFVPSDFVPQGTITNISLTLAWQIGDAPTSTPEIASTTIEETSSSTSTSTQIIAPSSTSFFSPKNLFSYFISYAFAQDETVDTSSVSVPPPAPTSTVNDSVTTIAVATTTSNTTTTTIIPTSAPIVATDTTRDTTKTPNNISTQTISTSASTSTTNSTTSGEASQGGDTIITSSSSSTDAISPVIAPPQPDENFLDVSYSTDGQTWVELQKVSIANWPHLTIAVPISNWDDLSRLQIRVQGIPTTQNPLPPVFMDGMLVEVHYDIPPLLQSQDQNNASTTPPAIQVAPNVTIQDAPTSSAPLVPAPNIVSVIKEGKTVKALVQYVGDFYGGNPLYLFVYPHGTTANRNGADAGYTFAQQPQEGPAINGLSIAQDALDPITKQVTVTLVMPYTPDDSHIATASMASGTYEVDIAYFDSDTWHLIPPQSFTWE